MSAEMSFLIALVIVLVITSVVIAVLVRPLRRVLRDLLGTSDRANFLTAFGSSLLVLVPVTCAIFGRVDATPHQSDLFGIVEQLKWPMIGLIVTIFVLAVGVGFCSPPTQPIGRVQFDELQRVLVKIQELRARELLNKLDALVPQHPSKRTQLVDRIVRLRSSEEARTEVR